MAAFEANDDDRCPKGRRFSSYFARRSRGGEHGDLSSFLDHGRAGQLSLELSSEKPRRGEKNRRVRCAITAGEKARGTLCAQYSNMDERDYNRL